jgi:hypothetical protein
VKKFLQKEKEDIAMVGDELSEKMVTVSFRTTGKLTAKGLKKLFGLILKAGGNILYHVTPNKESFNKLNKDGRPTQGIEVSKDQMCGFDKYARKYHFEYSLVQEKNDPNLYFFTFKAKDISIMDMAMKDYLKDRTIDHGDLKERIEHAKEEAFNFNKSRTKEKAKEHTKSHNRNRGVQR